MDNININIESIPSYELQLNEQGPQGATGPQGEQGVQGKAATIEIGTVTTGAAGSSASVTNSGTPNEAVFDFTIPKGDKGDAGNGIISITKTSTVGLVDTYTVLLTNNQTYQFTVTNGSSIASIELLSTVGLVDTYQITLTNGDTDTFTVTNGRGINSIAKTSTSGLVDTYTVTYNDNTTSTFTVTNGYSPTATATKSGNTTTITITDKNGTTTTNVLDGEVNADLSNLSQTGEERLHALKGYEDAGELLTDVEGLSDVEKYAHSSFDLSKFTVVGSPTITADGIASGFSSSNSITFPIIQLGDYNSWEVHCKFKTPATAPSTVAGIFNITYNTYFGGCFIQLNPNMALYIQASSSTDSSGQFISFVTSALQYDTDYDIVYKFTGTKYIVTLNGTEVYSLNSTTKVTSSINTCRLGRRASSEFFTGQIDLKQFSITVDGKEVFNGNKEGLDVIKPDDYTVVGSPTITNDGIASGFSSSNYLTQSLNLLPSTELKFKSKIVYSTQGNTSAYPQTKNILLLINGQQWRLCTEDQNKIKLYGNNITTVSCSPGTLDDGDIIDIEVIVIPTQITLKVSINGVAFTPITSSQSVTFTNITGFYLGSVINNYYFTGSIDLNSFKIYVDGTLVYQPCLKIPYTESKTGSKIVDYVYRDRVNDMYNQFGYSNYYTLQENNVPNYTIVGSPTISSDFVASGFSRSNYLTIEPFVPNTNTWTIFCKFTTGTIGTEQYLFSCGKRGTSPIRGLRCCIIPSGKLQIGISYDGSSLSAVLNGSTTLISNTTYNLIIKFNGTQYELILNNNIDGILTSSTSIWNSDTDLFYIGLLEAGLSFQGSIDLKSFKIYVDNKLVYQAVQPPCFTLPQGELYGLIGQQTLRNASKNGINRSFLYSDRTQWLTGSCTSGVEVTLPKAFADSNYMLSVPYSAKSATAFTPTQTGDWFAIGEGVL